MRNSMEAIGYQSQYIIVNGVRMTMTEYNKMKRAKNKAKRKKKELSEIQLLPSDIKTLMRNVKVFKSLVAFYNNGYKQWGTIHRELLGIDDMETRFVVVKLRIHEVNSIIENICEIAKKKEKSVYAYVQKLSYKMIETKECMQSLYDVVMGTNVINSPFATHEIISGTGRRLGLKILMYKTYDAIAEIDNIINKLHGLEEIPNSVYDNSRVMNYGKS